MTMRCPACSNALTAKQVGKLSVDICYGGCGGIWFDAFELQQVDDATEGAGQLLVQIERDSRIVVDPARKRECPRCPDIKLKRHLFSPSSKVEVDECPNCAGYWLDAGELEKIRDEKMFTEASRPAEISMSMIRALYRQRARE
jgi:Zn-finger nucleic acid-binding protein